MLNFETIYAADGMTKKGKTPIEYDLGFGIKH